MLQALLTVTGWLNCNCTVQLLTGWLPALVTTKSLSTKPAPQSVTSPTLHSVAPPPPEEEVDDALPEEELLELDELLAEPAELDDEVELPDCPPLLLVEPDEPA